MTMRHSLSTLLLVCTAALGLGVPAPVAAQSDDAPPSDDSAESSESTATDISDDLRMLSADNRIIGSADYEAFRATPYHDRLFDWAESRTGQTNVEQQWSETLGFNPVEALDRVVFGVPTDQMGSTPQDLEQFSVVFSGSFDNQTALDALRKHHDGDLATVDRPGDATVYQVEDLELAFTDAGEMTAIRGDDAYADTAWRTAAGDGATAVDAIAAYSGFDPVDRSRMLWMIKRSKGAQTGPADGLLQTAASLDLSGQLSLQVVAIAENESTAKQSAKEFKSISEARGSAGMLAMVGAGPLVENLTVGRSGNVVTAETSMTHQQFDVMLSAIREMTEQPDTVDLPGESSGNTAKPPNDAESGAEDDGDDTTTAGDDKNSESQDSSESGSDFN